MLNKKHDFSELTRIMKGVNRKGDIIKSGCLLFSKNGKIQYRNN